MTPVEQLAAGGMALAISYIVLYGLKLFLLSVFDHRLRVFPIDQLRPALSIGDEEKVEGEPARDPHRPKRQ